MFRKQISIGFVVILAHGLPIGSAIGENTPSSTNATPEDITTMIESKDPTKLQSAKAQIMAWLARGRVPKDFRNIWLPALVSQKKLDEALDLSLQGVFASPTTVSAQALLELRAQIYLEQGMPQQALAAEKSAFNVGEFRRSQHFIDGLATTLSQAYPTDPKIARRFRVEQSDGSASATQPATSATVKNIKIDPSLYEPGLRKWKETSKSFSDKVGYGNLLLIADEGREAEDFFRKLLESATSADQKVLAIEGIARALRAEDGALARANAWLQSQPPAPKTESPLP